MKEIKNKIEHNEGILREIRNRIMKEIWSIIPTSLPRYIRYLFFVATVHVPYNKKPFPHSIILIQ